MSLNSGSRRRSALRITICGSQSGADGETAAAALSQLPTGAEIVRQPGDPANWAASVGQGDLCIVFQSWPDEVPVAAAHAIVAACAASRLIVCQGAWCASAGRTRSLWPRAVCVSVTEFSARLQFELAVLHGQRDPLPATAALDEVFSASSGWGAAAEWWCECSHDVSIAPFSPQCVSHRALAWPPGEGGRRPDEGTPITPAS